MIELPTTDQTINCEVNNLTIIGKANEFAVPGDLVATAKKFIILLEIILLMKIMQIQEKVLLER